MKLKSNTIFKIILILFMSFLSLYIVYYFVERKSETYYEYKYRSNFYKMMRKKNKFDFIKTAEKEIENIDAWIKKSKSDDALQFRIFLTEEKIRLVDEIQKTKLKAYCKEGKVKLRDRPKVYKIFEDKYPELVLKFNDYGKVLEYKNIDYLRIFEKAEQRDRKKISKEMLDYYDLGKKHRAELKRIAEVLGAEYFGLTVNSFYWNLPMEYFKDYHEGTKCVENKRRQLLIQEGSQDLFYDNEKVGSISTKINDDYLICSIQYDDLDNENGLDNYKFEKRNNKDNYPYYCCQKEDYTYLIYPGISSSYYPLFKEMYCNSSYLISLDCLNPDQKKYVFVKCKNDFFEKLDSFNYFFEDSVIDKIFIFYQKENL